MEITLQYSLNHQPSLRVDLSSSALRIVVSPLANPPFTVFPCDSLSRSNDGQVPMGFKKKVTIKSPFCSTARSNVHSPAYALRLGCKTRIYIHWTRQSCESSSIVQLAQMFQCWAMTSSFLVVRHDFSSIICTTYINYVPQEYISITCSLQNAIIKLDFF
jgi:hypothetical protein